MDIFCKYCTLRGIVIPHSMKCSSRTCADHLLQHLEACCGGVTCRSLSLLLCRNLQNLIAMRVEQSERCVAEPKVSVLLECRAVRVTVKVSVHSRPRARSASQLCFSFVFFARAKSNMPSQTYLHDIHKGLSGLIIPSNSPTMFLRVDASTHAKDQYESHKRSRTSLDFIYSIPGTPHPLRRRPSSADGTRT